MPTEIAYATAAQGPQTGPVQQMIDALSSELSILANTIDDLGARLAPVLGPLAYSDPSVAPKHGGNERSPLADRLNSITGDVQAMALKVAELSSRVEV